MVVRRKKKILKRRGRGAGYGGSKQHRGGGARGGRGMAGLHKHKRMTTIKYMPDHFGKKGQRTPWKVITKIKTINLRDLDSMVDDLIKEKKIKEEKDGIKINLPELGYEKLLGSGKVKHRLIVEAKYFSKNAIKKIEEAKGKTIVVS